MKVLRCITALRIRTNLLFETVRTTHALAVRYAVNHSAAGLLFPETTTKF